MFANDENIGIAYERARTAEKSCAAMERLAHGARRSLYARHEGAQGAAMGEFTNEITPTGRRTVQPLRDCGLPPPPARP
jgi:hypothetical protein